jgi:hypothetical protein
MKHGKFPVRTMRSTCAVLLVAFLLFPSGSARAVDNEFTLTELRKERTKMAQRKRRIIFNNDGDDFEGSGGPENDRTEESAAMTATPEGLLELRTTALLGSQVDSIFYHVTHGAKLMYEDSAFRRIYEFPDRKPERREIAVRNLKALMANYGMDNLEVMIDCARKNGLEIFYSNRVNDVHDYYFPKFLSTIKARHPEYTIGHAAAAAERSPKETLQLMREGRKSYTGLNFRLQVVRDLTVESMREVCQNYDIDGIELDYFRSPRLFPSSLIKTTDGELVNVMEQLEKGFVGSPPPADPKDVELLNDMMRKMRQMTEEEGLRRGRPILIAARGINDPKYSLAFGLDFKTWLAEDLIDIVMPIHFGIPRGSHQGSLKEFIGLAHRYAAPAYPCLRYHRVYQHTLEARRGEAVFRFTEGADGMTTFNRFDPTHRMWHEMGDPEVLRDLDKSYTCPQYLPLTVTDKGCKPLRLLVGEDVRSVPPANKTKSLTLRIHVAGLTDGHGLQVELNGKPLDLAKSSPVLDDQPQEVWREYSLESTPLEVPEILVTARVAQVEGEVKIDDVQLDVLYLD